MSSPKHNQWVIVTDSNFCRIYDYHKIPNQLQLIKEINHPENKLKDIELTSDKPGRYRARDSAHGAYSQPSDPKAIKIDDFSREIAHEIEHGRTTNAYEKLIIITSPHMNGLLLHHFNQPMKDLIAHNIEKNLTHLNDHEILAFLNDIKPSADN